MTFQFLFRNHFQSMNGNKFTKYFQGTFDLNTLIIVLRTGKGTLEIDC